MIIKIKEVVTYGGHSLSANGSVNLTLKAAYSELSKSIQAMQMLTLPSENTMSWLDRPSSVIQTGRP